MPAFYIDVEKPKTTLKHAKELGGHRSQTFIDWQSAAMRDRLKIVAKEIEETVLSKHGGEILDDLDHLIFENLFEVETTEQGAEALKSINHVVDVESATRRELDVSHMLERSNRHNAYLNGMERIRLSRN